MIASQGRNSAVIEPVHSAIVQMTYEQIFVVVSINSTTANVKEKNGDHSAWGILKAKKTFSGKYPLLKVSLLNILPLQSFSSQSK